MSQDFVDWLVEQAGKGDPAILDSLGFRLDEHLVQHGPNKAAERQRIATEFRRRAPLTALGKDMLAVIER